ncbi:hypothetical protein E2C01_051922 [Portunus trituberculatus]|uniref:Uncharacterized protein n=1 Tax=Portunus trituberculatus TaxID=210409 RepID=A0A5B7GCA3_PORTR|nr:hypothetical protein [Portunus trituberculatus]
MVQEGERTTRVKTGLGSMERGLRMVQSRRHGMKGVTARHKCEKCDVALQEERDVILQQKGEGATIGHVKKG